jgi:citrate synthase
MEKMQQDSHYGTQYMLREEAVQLLGIKPSTLYTYVSRGWVRSIAGPHQKLRLYSREDVEQIRARGHARSGERFTANEGLRWGEPILHTAITQITPLGPKYRGRLAADLVHSHCSFEVAAELLWSGACLDEHPIWHIEPAPLDANRLLSAAGGRHGSADLLQAFSLLTLASASAEENRIEVQRGTTILAARRLIAMLVGCFGLLSKSGEFTVRHEGESIAEGLARAFGIPATDESVSALNAALVMLADHEMAPSTFAARVAASSSADLYSCIVSALATHTGTRIRKSCDKVESLFADAPASAEFHSRLMGLSKFGANLPGFNHPLYPKGDPRARLLLDLAKRMKSQTKQSERLYELIDDVARQYQAQPSVEIGLLSIAFALGLPKQGTVGLLTLGRVAGWVAHVLEQRLAGIMLRPTPRYTALE